jgi:dihydropteroate synthase
MTDSPAYARAGLCIPPCVVAFESLGPGLGASHLALRLGGSSGHVQFSKRALFLLVVADPSRVPGFKGDPVVGGRPSDQLFGYVDVIDLLRSENDSLYVQAMCDSWRAVWAHHRWRIRGGSLQLTWTAPKVVGVLNVTPDSFSDGGRWIDVAAAVEHGEALARAGAAMLDVGGESTRPGAERVSAPVQIERILPVIERLVARVAVPIVVDTTSAEVARAALAAGAAVVNDTSALADDPELAAVVAESGAGLILMHRRSAPATMQEAPAYACCVAEVAESLFTAAAAARRAGVGADQIVLDPGIGFGKRLQDNLDLIGGLVALKSLGFPVMLGASRKSFLGTITGKGAQERDAATLATTAAACEAGCELIRVHDVAGSVDVLRVLTALGGRLGSGNAAEAGAPPT